MDREEFIQRCQEMVDVGKVETIMSVYEKLDKLIHDILIFGRDGNFDTQPLTESIANGYIALMTLSLAIDVDYDEIEKHICHQLGMKYDEN